MSVFRPHARVTSPDRREWEIYAYKINVRGRADFGGDDFDATPVNPRAAAVDTAFTLLVNFVLLIPRVLIRLAQIGAAAARTLRSDEWTVDAVTYSPRETVYTWTTTSDHKGQVLAQIEGSLARGDIPSNLRNAVYRGEDRRSAR